jgi:hypothetical protein
MFPGMSFSPSTFNTTVLIDFKALSKSKRKFQWTMYTYFSHVIKSPEAVKHRRINRLQVSGSLMQRCEHDAATQVRRKRARLTLQGDT